MSPRGLDDDDNPVSSASSVASEMEHKRRKIDTCNDSDVRKPVFLKMSFRKQSDQENVDSKIEDDAIYDARPWQERSTIVPALVAFRVRFADLFEGVPDLGPQDIEEGVESVEPSVEVQEFMCRLLTLAANRAKPVEYPHYNRPLGDFVALNCMTKGDPAWEGTNPLASNKRFPDLSSDDRLRLLFCLLDWSLTESKVVRDKIEEAYRHRTATRIHSHNPYEFEVIGRDDQKHGYYLLKGHNTRFRLYIQTDLNKEPSRWYSICSNLEDLRMFTSQLSDAARTVRCRKIVDDLASIHIPEVERAEDVCKQILAKKQRAVLERNRRALYALDAAEHINERGSRTRGRRVDYNHMLQGQGDDEDEKHLSRRSTRHQTPEGSNVQLTRSGRLLKRPRGWDEESSDRELSQAIANSQLDSLGGVNMVEVPVVPTESHIVILKYHVEKYKNWVRIPWDSIPLTADSSYQKRQKVIDSVVVPDPLAADQQSLAKLYGPLLAAQMQKSVAEVIPNLSEGVPTSDRQPDETAKAGTLPATLPLGPKDCTPAANTVEPDGMKNSPGSQAEIEQPVSVGQNNRLSEHSLILATLHDLSLHVDYLDDVLARTMARAAQASVKMLYVSLYVTDEVQRHLSTYGAEPFLAIQKAISALYLQIAKLGKEKGHEVEAVVLFQGWCGYNLAQEDVIWHSIGAVSADQGLVQQFLFDHTRCFPDRVRCEVIQSPYVYPRAAATTRGAQSSRKYDIVAVGGTFDHLHAGHKILLTMTAWLAQEKVVCGITDDALLVNKKHKEYMQDIQGRTKNVETFYYCLNRGIEYSFVPINDVAGPTGNDPAIQALVASRETEAGSNQIVELRRERGLPALDILFIDVVGPDGNVDGEQMAELKLSSTAIRQRLASKL